MNTLELAAVVLLIALLAGLAVFFAVRQLRLAHALQRVGGPTDEEQRYLRRQTGRRLICSGLMLVFAAFLVGWIFLEREYRVVMREVGDRAGMGLPVQATDTEKDFVHFFAAFWGVALLVLLAILILAAVDVWATARFGLSQHRRLQSDRRESLADVARQHGFRNGSL